MISSLVTLLAILAADPSVVSTNVARPIGTWRDVAEPAFAVTIENERYLVFQGDAFARAMMIFEWTDGEMRHGEFVDSPTRWRRDGDRLILTFWNEKTERILTRLAETPASTTVAAMPLPAPNPVPEARVKEVEAALHARVARDQAVRHEKPPSEERDRVDADNTAFVRELVAELGWIDATRFGKQAAFHAWLIAHHSKDYPLRLAMIPFIERDVKSGALHASCLTDSVDAMSVNFGLTQRYGSIFVLVGDELILLPVDSVEAVDARRKEIGLPTVVETYSAYEVRAMQGPRAQASDSRGWAR